jgi:hypothetical protein
MVLPPVPVAWKTSTSKPLSSKNAARRLDRLGRVAEHRRGDQRPVFACRDFGLEHSDHGSRGTSEDAAADPVDPGDIDNTGDKNNVAHAHIGGDIPARDRGDDHLGDAERQSAEGAADDRRAARAAEREDAIEPSLGEKRRQQSGQPPAHRLYRRSPVGVFDKLCDLRPARTGDGGAVDVR